MPADEGMRADAHELMHADAAAEDGVVADLAMPAEHDVVRHDDVVADDAVVGDVRVGEEEAVVADARPRRALRRAWIDGHAFADGAVRSDRGAPSARRHISGPAAGGRRRRRGRSWRAAPIVRVPGQHDVAHELATRRRARHSAPMMQNGPIRTPSPSFAPGFDDGGRMDERLLEAPTSFIRSPAWRRPRPRRRSRPSTFASPLNHHMLRRLLIFLMWYSMTSPGTTGLRNFALSIVMKNTCVGRLSWLSFVSTQIAPAVCAMPSIR